MVWTVLPRAGRGWRLPSGDDAREERHSFSRMWRARWGEGDRGRQASRSRPSPNDTGCEDTGRPLLRRDEKRHSEVRRHA